MLYRAMAEGRPEVDRAKRDCLHHVPEMGSPLEDSPIASGLRAAVRQLVVASQACGGPEIEFWDDLPTDDFPAESQQAVLSIVQELLLNACRHSKSKRVLLGLAQDDGRLCVQVQDWGVGFDRQGTSPCKRGLKGIGDLIEWLGGTLDIDSKRGEGTCVVAEVPLSRQSRAKGRDDAAPGEKSR